MLFYEQICKWTPIRKNKKSLNNWYFKKNFGLVIFGISGAKSFLYQTVFKCTYIIIYILAFLFINILFFTYDFCIFCSYSKLALDFFAFTNQKFFLFLFQFHSNMSKKVSKKKDALFCFSWTNIGY